MAFLRVGLRAVIVTLRIVNQSIVLDELTRIWESPSSDLGEGRGNDYVVVCLVLKIGIGVAILP